MEHVLFGVLVVWSNVINGNAKKGFLKIASGRCKKRATVHQSAIVTQKEISLIGLGILKLLYKQKMVVRVVLQENQKFTAQIANVKTANSHGVDGANVQNSIPQKGTAITTGRQMSLYRIEH